MISSSGHILKSHIEPGDRPSSRHIQKYGYMCIGRSQPRDANSPTQVTKLCGPEPLTKYCVLATVVLQVACAVCLRGTPVFSLRYILTAYIVGATVNQNLFLAIHEISHNLAFRAPLANRLLAVFANLPIGIPYSAAFRVSLEGMHHFQLPV